MNPPPAKFSYYSYRNTKYSPPKIIAFHLIKRVLLVFSWICYIELEEGTFMKFGVRKPSLKKSIKARTTGKMKRKAKSAVNPFYGKKGMGYVKNPKKAVYNKVYNKTTVGANPLSYAAKTKKKSRSTTATVTPSDKVVYTKYKTLEKEIAVTSSFEKFIRRLFRKDSIDSKIVKEKIIVEQYTYGEVQQIKNEAERHIEIYNESIRLAKSTTNPETFFPRLSSAEDSLAKVVHMVKQYAFLTVEGDDLEAALSQLKQDKTEIITDFVDRHYIACVESAEKLKTENGKTKRYVRNFQEYWPFFSDLNPSVIQYIHDKWSQKIPENEFSQEMS